MSSKHVYKACALYHDNAGNEIPASIMSPTLSCCDNNYGTLHKTYPIGVRRTDVPDVFVLTTKQSAIAYAKLFAFEKYCVVRCQVGSVRRVHRCGRRGTGGSTDRPPELRFVDDITSIAIVWRSTDV